MKLRLPRFLTGDDEADGEKRRLEAGDYSPKFEPTEKTPDLTKDGTPAPVFNAPQQAPASTTQPVFDPVAAAASTNTPQARQAQPQFNVPAEAAADPNVPRFGYDPATTPIPVYDRHGAPTGAVEGGGSAVQKSRAAVQAEEDYTPVNHNSRLAGIGLGAERGFQRGGVLGAIFGAVRGGVNQSTDEEFAHNRRLGKEQGAYTRAATREKDEQTVLNDEQKRQIDVAKFMQEKNQHSDEQAAKERADALKNLDQYEAIDPTNAVHAQALARAKKAGWDVDPATWGSKNRQTVFDQETGRQMERRPGTSTWTESRDEKGNPITTKSARAEKLPDSFYELDGQSDKTIHADAVAKAGLKDFSSKAELDPAKVELYKSQMGMSDKDIKDGIELGTIKMSELVKDSQRDEARRYDAAVAGAESSGLKRLSLYRQAVDQTQTAPAGSPVVSIAVFQQKYKQFFDTYNALYKKDPQAAEAKRAEFFNALRGFRLR